MCDSPEQRSDLTVVVVYEAQVGAQLQQILYENIYSAVTYNSFLIPNDAVELDQVLENFQKFLMTLNTRVFVIGLLASGEPDVYMRIVNTCNKYSNVSCKLVSHLSTFKDTALIEKNLERCVMDMLMDGCLPTE